MADFNVTFSSDAMTFDVGMSIGDGSFSPAFDSIQPLTQDAEAYQGPYDVTPSVRRQHLETKDRLMRDDVTIREIPYFETSNDEGGNTIYIGKEL